MDLQCTPPRVLVALEQVPVAKVLCHVRAICRHPAVRGCVTTEINVSATAVPVADVRRKQYIVLFGLPIGVPQIVAGILLSAFLTQALWIALRTPLRPNELAQIQQGQMWFAGHAGEVTRAPLVPLLSAVAVAGSGVDLAALQGPLPFRGYPASWRWRARLPFLLIGVLLGASLWYVARRLFGNTGGFIAIAMFAFTPALLQDAATVQGPIVAAWAAFGIVFTSVAVAHTLYAPREVVLWNWRRIVLLGVSIAIALAVKPVLVLLIPVSLAFMLYLVPARRRESLIIVGVACAAAVVLLLAVFGLHASSLLAPFTGFRGREFAPELFVRGFTWNLLGVYFLRMPAVLLLLVASLATYAVWKRPRYFGVTQPLAIWFLLMALGIVLPFLGGYALFVVALPFAFVFIAGVLTDAIESRFAALALGPIAGMLMAHAAVNVLGLSRIP